MNIATHRRHANGFSPVCTRKWVFRFHDMPNCLPQYSQRYSRTGAVFPEAVEPVLPPVPVLDELFRLVCWLEWLSMEFSDFTMGLEPITLDDGIAVRAAVCGGHGYTNEGGICSGPSALGGRRRLLL